jgi:hypothetical protein
MQTQMTGADAAAFDAWLAALQTRYLADLRTREVTRALRALSSLYVERRADSGVHRALDSAGKRAAFGLFYGPLHFLTTYLVVRALNAAAPPPRLVIDLGCGTGAAGAAFALAAGRTPRIVGLDRHAWAAAEATWTYRRFGLSGHARRGDLEPLPSFERGDAIVAGYVLNELSPPGRSRILKTLIDAASRGARVLVLEPISRRIAPWWDDAAAQLGAAGAQTAEWRFRVDLPGILATLDKGAGLDHRELTARSIYCRGSAGQTLAPPPAANRPQESS